MWPGLSPSVWIKAVWLIFGNITLQRLEPVQQGSVGLPEGFSRNPLICGSGQRALFQGGLLGAKGNLSIPIRCLQARVAQPGADDIYFNAGLQKVDRSAVAPD